MGCWVKLAAALFERTHEEGLAETHVDDLQLDGESGSGSSGPSAMGAPASMVVSTSAAGSALGHASAGSVTLADFLTARVTAHAEGSIGHQQLCAWGSGAPDPRQRRSACRTWKHDDISVSVTTVGTCTSVFAGTSDLSVVQWLVKTRTSQKRPPLSHTRSLLLCVLLYFFLHLSLSLSSQDDGGRTWLRVTVATYKVVCAEQVPQYTPYPRIASRLLAVSRGNVPTQRHGDLQSF